MPMLIWQIIPQIDNPYSLTAYIGSCLLLIFLTGCGLYWKKEKKRYEVINNTTDPESKRKMLQASTETYLPEDDNLKVDQKFELLKTQQQHKLTRFKWGVFAGLIVLGLVLLFFRAILSPQNHPPQKTKSADPNGPLARIDNYQGSALIHKGGAEYTTGISYSIKNPRDEDPDRTYPVVTFELAKLPEHDTIKINEIRASWQAVQRQLGFISEYVSGNYKPPITFGVKLSRKRTSGVGFLKIEGKLADGLITFTEAEPIATCRVEFEGEPGLYLVNLEVDIQEARGDRKQTLKTPKPVFVYVAQKQS